MSAAAYVAAVLADTPRAFYQLQDASGNPVDSSGNALNMTSVTGAPAYHEIGPLSDFAIRLESTETLVRSTQVSTVVDNFTMEIWIKLTSVGSNGRNVLSNGFSATTGWGILVDTDFKFLGAVNDGAGVGSKSVNPLSTSAYHMINVLRRAATWEYYFDGALDTPTGAAGVPGIPAGPVQVGAGSVLDATVAYASIYETALSAGRILAHYQAAVGTAGPADDAPFRILGFGAA